MHKILIIDESGEIKHSLLDLLESRKFKLLWTNEINLGFELAHSFQPSLIISDLDIPSDTKLDLLDRVRYSKSTAHIPFVFLSINTDGFTQDLALRMGANAILSKFAPIFSLVRRIYSLLNAPESRPAALESDVPNNFQLYVNY